MQQIGENIARLHDFDVMHGDPTTSNMLIKFEEDFFDLAKKGTVPNIMTEGDFCVVIIAIFAG